MLRQLFKNHILRRYFFVAFAVFVVPPVLVLLWHLYGLYSEHRLWIIRLELRQYNIDKAMKYLQYVEKTRNTDFDEIDLFYRNNVAIPMSHRVIEHLKTHLRAPYVPPILLDAILRDGGCDGIRRLTVTFGEELRYVRGVALHLHGEETILLEDGPHWIFFPDFQFERYMVFYCLKEDVKNCLILVLPKYLRDFTATNVVFLNDDAFDKLVQGTASVSLILYDGTHVGFEKILIAPDFLPTACQDTCPLRIRKHE